MSTFIPPTPAATKSAEQHQEPSEQDSFNHLLYKVLRLTSEQVQDLNDWMAHRGIPNVHEAIAQNFRKPHALEDNLKLITQGKTSYIQSNEMISLSLMISYIKHHQYSAKSKYFGPFYYIQIDPQDYDEWCTSPPEEEIHFQTPSKFGSATTPRSTVSSEASESYITLTNFKKGIKRDASAYPILKNERYYNTFIHHFKATAKAQGLNSLMDPNFTPGSDEHEQQLFQEQQDFLYSVLISSLKIEFSEALVKDHEGDAQLIVDLLHEHHTGNSQYSRAEIKRITKYLTNIKLDDTWRGTNESFLMHYNDQLHLLDSLVDSDEKLPDNTRVTFLESAFESVPAMVQMEALLVQICVSSTKPTARLTFKALITMKLLVLMWLLLQASSTPLKGKSLAYSMNMPTLGRDHPFIHQVNLNRLRPMLMKNLSKLVVPNLSLLWMDILSLSESRMVWPHLPWKTHRSGHGHISTCLFHLS